MILDLIIYGGFAGITVFLGGILANYFNHHMQNSPIKQEITHTLMSFGSGIILSALALVLIPKGLEELDLIFIGLQNLPEAFNSFRDLVLSGFTPKKTLTIFFFLSFFGIFGALIGHFLLSDYPALTAHLMTFASGGILYLLIQDIIPESKIEKNYLISIGASIGFLVGIIGEKIV